MVNNWIKSIAIKARAKQAARKRSERKKAVVRTKRCKTPVHVRGYTRRCPRS